jgi:4-hydroxy-2-oxoheptanedioate aldolase
MMPLQTLTTNLFKKGLTDGRKQPGLWLTLESPTSTEIVAGSGYDWLLLDMEHTTLDPSQVAEHIRAAKGGTAERADHGQAPARCGHPHADVSFCPER